MDLSGYFTKVSAKEQEKAKKRNRIDLLEGIDTTGMSEDEIKKLKRKVRAKKIEEARKAARKKAAADRAAKRKSSVANKPSSESNSKPNLRRQTTVSSTAKQVNTSILGEKAVKSVVSAGGAFVAFGGDDKPQKVTLEKIIKLTKCVALYGFAHEKSNTLSFVKGDVIEIVHKKVTWWCGRLDGKVGFFPPNYVKELSCNIPMRANKGYLRKKQDVLRYVKGDVVYLLEDLEKAKSKWVYGQHKKSGQYGYFLIDMFSKYDHEKALKEKKEKEERERKQAESLRQKRKERMEKRRLEKLKKPRKRNHSNASNLLNRDKTQQEKSIPKQKSTPKIKIGRERTTTVTTTTVTTTVTTTTTIVKDAIFIEQVSPLTNKVFGTALFDYKSHKKNNLPFKRGELVRMINWEDKKGGWWLGVSTTTQKFGWFPAKYMRLIKPEVELIKD